jgi:4-hydroxythreonine-4-phosphate dehydrogenase
MKPVIAITVGDYNGIGPEIALKSLLHPAVRKSCQCILVGPGEAFAYARHRLNIPVKPPFVLYTPSGTQSVRIQPGRISSGAGHAAGRALEAATSLALSGTVSAIVTGPVSKRALHLAGFMYPGQTEMLQHLTRARSVAMMLVSPRMKVGLVTIHLPLRQVPYKITRKLVTEKVVLVHQALRKDWLIRSPRIALLSLNPHAGENGDLGTEETRIILPAVRQLRRSRIRVEGPYPADAFFGRFDHKAWDAIMAMYHDQGLVPLKQTAGGKAVNYSAGLPVIRTSPGHGTAMDIAGKGVADCGSMVEAILLAAMIARHRQQHGSRH